jgi:hypothetical protein
MLDVNWSMGTYLQSNIHDGIDHPAFAGVLTKST